MIVITIICVGAQILDMSGEILNNKKQISIFQDNWGDI